MPSKALNVVSARAFSPCVRHTSDGALRWAPPDVSGNYGAVVAFATLSLAIPGLVIRPHCCCGSFFYIFFLVYSSVHA